MKQRLISQFFHFLALKEP